MASIRVTGRSATSQARRDPGSEYRDWYVWSKKKPKRADRGMVFSGVQQTTWSRDKVAKAYTSIASTIFSRT